VVSSIREKIYKVEKQKKVDRRNAKEGVALKPVKEPEVEKVVDSGEVKATPSPEPKAKKKGRPKKEK
tara:strand:+ start:218 stop:418 length:201 start_codon:yes stop_codon:yes gene_type:complete